MTRPRWLLERSPHFTDPERLLPLVEAPILIEHGELIGHEALPALSGPLAAFGTMSRMRGLLRRPGAADAVFDVYAELRCTRYYRHVYPHLGRAAVFVPMAAMAHLPLRRLFGEQVFVRPDDNTKPFQAAVISTDREAVAEHLRLNGAHADGLVVLSEVVALGPEFRCFVRDGVVFAHSSYPERPYRPAPAPVIAFAEQVARDLACTGMNLLTVDVAWGADRLRLVEVGGVNSWGLYGADEAAFVAAMEAEALRRHAELWG